MPKAAQHVLIYKQDQNSHWLYKNNNGDYAFLQGDSEQWFAWLAEHTSFSFQRLHGHLNMLKEARKSGGKGEDGYWYAYRRQGKRTMKKYAGRTADLTMARLETIAHAFTNDAHHTAASPDHVTPNLIQSTEHESTEMMTENALTLTPPPLTPIQTPLLQPKLHLPRLHTNLVERERLLTLLDASLERKLTLITAPPGFGKTTLLLQWLAHQNTPDSFAWVALDAGDNDPIRFWRYVLTACQSFQSDHGHEVLHQLSTIAPSPFEPSPLETVLTTFLNALTRHAYDGILILEDYHLITSPYIHQTITFLLDHLPPTLHLILLSRSDPPLPLARLRARGDLCEIHTAELRFSQEETLTFLQQNLSLPSYTLSPQMIRQLDIHLEGWAAGLRLLTFALRGNKSQQEVERILATFTSNHPAQRPIQDYFAAHVHSPFSGQGLNLGIGDAVNLGWKLGATVQGWAPEGLLDTYTSERHPIGAWVLDWTRAQVAVMRGDAYSHSLRGVVTDFLGTRDGATYYVKRISGLWQRYDLGNGHPLVGTTMPNLRLDDGTRLSDHTHEGRSLLVDLTGDDRLAALARPYAGRLELVRGRSNGAGVSGLLVRPDGFVAWASADGASDSPGLEAALTRWLGDGMGRSN